MKLSDTKIQIFWSRVNKCDPNDCWEWKAGKLPSGYGRIRDGFGKIEYAHRMSWIIINGDIPNGMEVCHKCDNPPCVNPNHLFIATHHENMLDRERKGRGARLIGLNRKLTPEQAEEIRGMHKPWVPGFTLPDLAKKYGISPSTVKNYVKGKYD